MSLSDTQQRKLTTLISPEAFTAAEIDGARQIRQRLSSSIPAEFDTDFYLARWWRSYDGDLKMIERRMKELFEHRRAIGYDRIETAQLETKLEFARKTFERFSISSLVVDRNSGNMSVFVQKMAGTDLKEIMKVIPLSYVVHSYFILQESFSRTQITREAQSGSPCAVATILDLEGLNLADFINPLSTATKTARLVVKVWADYFTEGLVKLFIINPPGLLNVMWQIARFIMDKKTQSRVTFLDNPSDLLKYLSPQAVPEEYGGTWRDDSGRAQPPESACRKAIRVLPQHYYDVNELWRRHGFPALPDVTCTNLKGKRTVEVTKTCEKEGQSLLWHFTVNGDIEFGIVRTDGPSETPVWPKVTLTTLKAPEQGSIQCTKGEYKIRFTNPNNSWVPLKLNYFLAFAS